MVKKYVSVPTVFNDKMYIGTQKEIKAIYGSIYRNREKHSLEVEKPVYNKYTSCCALTITGKEAYLISIDDAMWQILSGPYIYKEVQYESNKLQDFGLEK